MVYLMIAAGEETKALLIHRLEAHLTVMGGTGIGKENRDRVHDGAGAFVRRK